MSRRSPTDTKTRQPRRRTAEDRLTEALATLSQRDGARTSVLGATVTELCRLAAVSRNSLYRYHAGILTALRKLQCRAVPAARSRARKADEQLRAENVLLARHISSLAALVDHYYGAYRETSALLERRDRELAEVRRSLKVKPALVTS